MNPYPKITKKLTNKQKTDLIAQVAQNVFDKLLKRHERQRMFRLDKDEIRIALTRKEFEDMIRIELALVKEQAPEGANDYEYNTPRNYTVGYAVDDLVTKSDALRKELIPSNPERTLQHALNEIDVKYYSMSGGQSRTITHNHHSPLIASVVIKELGYAVGIVKTPRTFQCFEIMRQTYGTKLFILSVKDCVRKLESLNGKTLKAETDEKEYEILKQTELVEAL